jgi:hypothetical protein
MIGSAYSITMATGESSGMLIGFVAGNADDTNGPPPPDHAMDVDVYKIGVPGAGWVTAEVFSTARFGSGGYNTAMELLDPFGMPIFGVDNVHYDDDTYSAGTLQQTDPLLLNIPVPGPGFYYIRLTNPAPMEVGTLDAYWLLAGWQAVAVPEPGSVTGLLAVGALAMLRRGRAGKTAR